MTEKASQLATLEAASDATGFTQAELASMVTDGRLEAVDRDADGRPLYRLKDIETLCAQRSPARVYAALRDRPDLGADANERDTILSSLPYFARKLLDADYAALTVNNAEGRIAQMFVSGMGQDQAISLGAPPVGRGVLGMMGPGGVAIRLHDIADHPRSVGLPEGHPPMQALLGVSIDSGDIPTANLYVTNSPGRPQFTPEDQELLESLAAHARTALEVERLHQQEARMRQESEQARAAAEAAQSRSDAIIAEATVGVLLADASGQVVMRANSEMERILGMPLTPGTSFTEIFERTEMTDSDGRAIDSEHRPVYQAATTGKPYGPENVFLSAVDDHRRPVLVSAAPIEDAKGVVREVVVVMQDTSVLEEVEQAKSDFLSMVTHDLKTPITTIKAMLADVRLTRGSEHRSGDWADAVEEEADYLNELVGNLLDMSRIESNADLFDYEQCHMLDLVGDAVRRARRSHGGNGREINFDVPSDLPLTYADPSQIGRVLDNLLSNALKYSDKDVNLLCSLDADGALVTQIQDFGRGIPLELIDQVFDKFLRVHRGRQAGREGSGLGLAVSKAIVEAHGGSIGVDSVEGNGSTFWFSLPAEC